ncbi:hypothetical protein EMPG_12866 [Blastomyces silverae]|uniref:Uncharacterized protein n=1 Tax=Blastomyces silverae TaxID=2060906 RepID=A0A0H1BS96_9EURO|nr:hypothetical protein EMPG_12866 [Blastomyces silverae]
MPVAGMMLGRRRPRERGLTRTSEGRASVSDNTCQRCRRRAEEWSVCDSDPPNATMSAV